MSDLRADRIEKPSWWKIAPLRGGRGKRRPYVIGFDSEAEHGRPFMFQFATPDKAPLILPVGRKKGEAWSTFLRYLWQTCTRRDEEYLVFGFNLSYEWTQFVGDGSIPSEVYTAPTFQVEGRGAIPYLATFANDKRYFATVEFLRDKRTIRILDAHAYFTGSLDSVLKSLGLQGKLPKPKHFARKYANDPDFRAYAIQDAVGTRQLGEIILAWHRDLNVTTCITAPHFAAKVFRHAYLDAELDRLPVDVEQIGLDTYHGGKNGYYRSGPMMLKNVYNYDIRSAYPEAMRQLPCLSHLAYAYVTRYEAGVHALYHATVSYTGCDYDPVYATNGTRIRATGLMTIATTSYELDAMLACGCVTIISCTGYRLWSECDCDTALARYVRDWYRVKRTGESDAERTLAKLLLNSLYGKFFQKQPLGEVSTINLEDGEIVTTDPDAEYDYRAGGLYHPPIASLITGSVRAKIHRLEHKYRAIMTSTDGLFATLPPDPSDLGDEIGDLSVQLGTLRIRRERLYKFTPTDGSKPKYALHGFRGSPAEFDRVPMSNRTYRYLATEMVTLKRSVTLIDGRRYLPGEFVERSFELLPMAASP